MRVAIPTETTPGEKRVAATPASVKKLLELGFEVTVQAGAGEAAGFSDAAYTEAGASLAATAAEVLSAGDVVLKVEAPTPVTSIPLPGMNEAQPTSPPAERPASEAPAADFSANVPLPSLPDLDLPEDDDLDLDGLLEGLENVVDGYVSTGATSSIDSELDALLSGLDDLL